MVRVPVKRLDLGQVSGRLYDALDWMTRHTVLGSTPEQVALFLLTKEMEDRLRSGQFDKDSPNVM